MNISFFHFFFTHSLRPVYKGIVQAQFAPRKNFVNIPRFIMAESELMLFLQQKRRII